MRVCGPEVPTRIEVGLREEIMGEGLLIVNVCEPEVPPPGVGLKTVMLFVPAAEISAAVIVVVNWVELTSVVALVVVPHLITDWELKFVPFTVRVKSASPAVLDVGEMLETVGSGLLMVKVRLGVDVPPPGVGLVTEIVCVPALTKSAALNDIDNEVDELKVVVLEDPS